MLYSCTQRILHFIQVLHVAIDDSFSNFQKKTKSKLKSRGVDDRDGPTKKVYRCSIGTNKVCKDQMVSHFACLHVYLHYCNGHVDLRFCMYHLATVLNPVKKKGNAITSPSLHSPYSLNSHMN